MWGVVKGSQYQDSANNLTHHTGVRIKPHGTTEDQPKPTSAKLNTNLDWEIRHERSKRLAGWGGIIASSLSKGEPRPHQEPEARRSTTATMVAS